jgi:23S rRNA (guanine2445-N2)-methyltransferase / 23S rRNA (guanine2069-N7)-methyltransferase
MTSALAFFATAPKGLESLVADELRALGAENVRETRAGVSFGGDLVTGYRACLWSRCASRILLLLDRFPADSAEALYQGIKRLAWEEHLAADGTLAVDFTGEITGVIHTRFGAQKIKDAIVDRLRDLAGMRPSVDTERPDLRIHAHGHHGEIAVSLDLSGESLHRRGYRSDPVTAPLKENLAAAILIRAQWPQVAAQGGALVDLMCGSGTLPIEGAMIAADCAPGLGRDYFGFLGWRGHQPAVWQALVEDAETRRAAGIEKVPPIFGYDRDMTAIRAARANAIRAGFGDCLRFERRPVEDCVPAEDLPKGLVVVNPPYGERIGEESELPGLYRALGDALKRCYPGFRAALFTGNPDLGKRMGLRANRWHALFNGAIPCRLLHFEVTPEHHVDAVQGPVARAVAHAAPDAGGEMFANRLRKNLRELGKWAKREGVSCYRVYDADMKEYALAIDLYHTVAGERLVHVQEYAAPETVDVARATARRRAALAVLPATLEVPVERVYFKMRQRQKGGGQYEKLDARGEFHEVEEYGCRLLVNLVDYLDTGLFLDHRLTRRWVQENAKGKRFLNLFAYTGSATVHAARGGASATTTVDMSQTYLDWAGRNLALNGIKGPAHRLVRADARVWLDEAPRSAFDLVFLDPPTFSRSARMEGTFDVLRDHVPLIESALRALAPGGTLLFSTNHQRFKLDTAALAGLEIEDLSAATLPKDFARHPRIHRCWRIQR